MITTLYDLEAALNSFDVNDRVFIDLETTSGDDKKPAFNPYHGDKTSVIIIGTKVDNIIAIPLRHQTEGMRCIEMLDEALEMIAAFAKRVKTLCNLNVKFDMHFMAQDGITFSDDCVIEDTGVLARLVYNEHFSYSLENLCKTYNVSQKLNTAKAWCEANDTKDYGKVPLDILVPYGIADVVANIELHYLLLSKLPRDSQPVWDIERAVTPVMFDAERRGIPINRSFLIKKKMELLGGLIEKCQAITALSGIENPDSTQQVGAYFNSVGIKSNKFTDDANTKQSWDKDVMEWIGSLGTETPHKVANLLYDYGKEAMAHATFCDGWLKHLTTDDIIHTNIKQAGTRSGRSSSENPNSQNTPKWMLEAIVIPKGYVGVAWDMSQVEYRLFAHYAKDPDVLANYASNPRIDYHQLLADKLGIPRNPTKRINFGILYGMGKGKTTMTLRREIIEHDSPELRAHLYAQYFDPFETVPDMNTAIPLDVLNVMADNILKEYHNKLPSIKAMQGEVKQLLRSRGYIKDYYGRYFYLPVDKAYVGLNRVIQGCAADVFKKKMTEVAVAAKRLDYRMQLQIHDAMYGILPLQYAQEYVQLVEKTTADTPFRVPLLVDFDLALYNWKNHIKIKSNTDIVSEIGKLCFTH